MQFKAQSTCSLRNLLTDKRAICLLDRRSIAVSQQANHHTVAMRPRLVGSTSMGGSACGVMAWAEAWILGLRVI